MSEQVFKSHIKPHSEGSGYYIYVSKRLLRARKITSPKNPQFTIKDDDVVLKFDDPVRPPPRSSRQNDLDDDYF